MREDQKYQYSNSDLLKKPQNYQMTPYQGVNFLYAHRKSRSETLKIIETKINSLIVIDKIIEELGHDFIDYKFNQKEISTETLLKTILTKIQKQEDDNNINKIINILIKNFEVKKKIFSSYSTEFKETSNDYSFIRNYILLSVICSLKYEKTCNLKYINTVLKLNDIICSQINKVNDELDYCLCKMTLLSELRNVANLCEKKGIKI